AWVKIFWVNLYVFLRVPEDRKAVRRRTYHYITHAADANFVAGTILRSYNLIKKIRHLVYTLIAKLPGANNPFFGGQSTNRVTDFVPPTTPKGCDRKIGKLSVIFSGRNDN